MTVSAKRDKTRSVMKELSKYFGALARAATFARQGISDPAAARAAIKFEERLTKLAATAGKSAKPRRTRRSRSSQPV